uniref:SFRICE_020429 n=1 Tax=Spodoptera frugiperda TaxID=7108 RepID=A0A2H1VXW2_SPOFR
MLWLCCVVSALLLQAGANPAQHMVVVGDAHVCMCVCVQPLQPEQRPLSLVSELGSRLGAHPARLQDARLPLPSPQDLDAIKKVAQILVTLGQQVLGSRYSARVIPGIIGEPVPAPGGCEPAAGADDVPTDPVTLDRQPA